MNTKLQRAQKFIEQRLFANANELFQEVYNKDGDPEALYGLGICASQENDYPAALNYLTELLRLDPEHAKAYNQAGIIAYKMGDLEWAKSLFIVSIEKDPSFIEAQRNYGESLLATEEFENGIQVFLTILENHHEDVPTMLRMAELNEEAERFEEAFLWSLKAVELEPSNDHAIDLHNKIQSEMNASQFVHLTN